ncbi:MAG: ABC transporter permease, partial [Intestinibacter sp.]|uniref:ABC transporter permease n=1 Tax=Intestinibacter sp. TaxID=1965304 RepID=UPI003F13B54F
LSVIETEDGLGIILPALTLAFSHMGSYIRLIRGNMLEVLNKDYIKAAKAKGLSTKVVMFKHALKNALLPIMTKFGITVGGFIGGSTIIEIVFSFRGLGTYIMSAITNQDYPVIQAYVIFMAFVIVMINLIVDILYVAVDPRIELR